VIVFLEHWEDRDALAQHFAQPASLAFVTELSELAAERPTMSIYEASLLER
jgi:quinol monooxygenase YgiN